MVSSLSHRDSTQLMCTDPTAGDRDHCCVCLSFPLYFFEPPAWSVPESWDGRGGGCGLGMVGAWLLLYLPVKETTPGVVVTKV